MDKLKKTVRPFAVKVTEKKLMEDLEFFRKKALELGATKHEISDALVVAVGVVAAGVIDASDKAARKLSIQHFA